MASVITILDIELVVLGGGFAERLGEPFRLRVEAEVAERAFAGISLPLYRSSRRCRWRNRGSVVG